MPKRAASGSASPSPSPTPDLKPTLKKAKPANSKKLNDPSATAARGLIAQMVGQRGIAAVMADKQEIMDKTGLTAEQIKNHLNKGRPLRKAIEEAMKGI